MNNGLIHWQGIHYHERNAGDNRGDEHHPREKLCFRVEGINTGVALGKSDKVKAKIDGAYQHKETANQQNNIALKVTHTRVVGGKAADGNSRKGMANSIEG